MIWVIIFEMLFAVVGAVVAYLYLRSGRKTPADWTIALLIFLFIWVFCSTILLAASGDIKVGI